MVKKGCEIGVIGLGVMVHNGIEYGLMQLIAETYDVMKRGLGMSTDALHAVYDDWNRAELNGYLIEITSKIFIKGDITRTGRQVISRNKRPNPLDQALRRGEYQRTKTITEK